MIDHTAPFRRIVTGHDAAGLSAVTSSDSMMPMPIPSGDAAFALVWTSQGMPVDHASSHVDAPDGGALTQREGTVLRVVDMLPGRSSPMHRTNSLDYGIVLSGALELELEDGSVTRLQPGDIVVQRGTNHLWRNPDADAPCRIAFILIDARPAIVDGEPLPEIHP